MDPSPLVRETIDVGAEFLGELPKSLPFSVAFWLKATEVGKWYLYVASDQLADKRYPPTIPAHLTSRIFGGESVDELYIDSAPLAVAGS